MPENIGLAIPDHSALTFAPEGRQVSSLDMATKRGQKLWVRAMNSECNKLSDYLDRPINVVDAVAHEVALVSERSGEVQVCIRLVVVDSDNECYQCVSTGAWESLRRICVMLGHLPWPEGNVLIPRQRSLSGGKRMFYFDLNAGDDFRDEPAPRKRKAKEE